MEMQRRRTAAQLAIMLTAAHRRVTRLRPIPARLRYTCTPPRLTELNDGEQRLSWQLCLQQHIDR